MGVSKQFIFQLYIIHYSLICMFYAMQCVTRGSDYGSLSTLGSSLLKLDLIEPGTGPDTKLEVLGHLMLKYFKCLFLILTLSSPSYETATAPTSC